MKRQTPTKQSTQSTTVPGVFSHKDSIGKYSIKEQTTSGGQKSEADLKNAYEKIRQQLDKVKAEVNDLYAENAELTVSY